VRFSSRLLPLHRFPPMYQSHRRATFKTFGWSAMMVCNEDGRCWRERRVTIRDPGDSYGYAPRGRYIERRGYEERGGIGFRAPGVSVGIGTDRY
jgi:hypothetical protein